MATLLEGRQYGLSSKGHLNENKTRILVKFTDSSWRAVDELLNTRNGSKGHPTIQFHGNQGFITFPSVHSANGEHSFSFGVAPFSECEGPQSIECIQQCGSRTLESLGSLQLKMLIHAKEDVYEATKQRMAVAEEESKKNCTKVIKPTDTYVGRKIKKHTLSSKLSPFNGNNHHSKSNGSSMYNSKPNGMNGYHNNNSNGYLNKSVLNSKPSVNAEIQKRLFKDRVIHLLATRSYKYPDLLSRLMKDGMNDKDKQSLNSILNKVAVLKESMYTLSKASFSEVQEDWPFYTDFERQLLKRRKGQTAAAALVPSTQPTGNDSPLNAHNGSSPNSLPKRPSSGVEPSTEPPSAKRPRISHYNGNGNKYDAADVYGPSSKGEVIQNNSWPESNHVNGYLRTSSDSLRNGNVSKSETNGYHNVHNKSDHRHSSSDILRDKIEVNGHSDSYSQRAESNGWNSSSNYNLNNHNANNQAVTNGASINSNRHHNLSPTMGALAHMTPLPSPDGQDGLELRGFLSETCNGSSDSDSNSDYVKRYTEILTSEQRTRYKSDYNAEYLKYRDVHAVVDRVSKRFTVLKENLRNVDEGSDEWIKVREQILREYGEMKRDNKFQDAKHKFQVMHEKLSHIKRLIFEYDQQNGVGLHS